QAARQLARHLFLRAENVSIVLGKSADAGHAAELAGLLPAVDRAELRQADGEVAVAVGVAGVDADVVRAVHRLEHEAVHPSLLKQGGQFGARTFFVSKLLNLLRVNEWRELAVAVVGVMPAGAVEAQLADV